MREQLLLAVDPGRDHAAAGRGLVLAGLQLLLHFGHLLLELLRLTRQLLHVAAARTIPGKPPLAMFFLLQLNN